MRRAILLLVVMAAGLVLASGVALAVNKIGTQGRDFLKGTGGADNLVGRGENDRIFSLARNDTLIGGPGKDLLWGGRRRSLHGDLPVHYTSSGGEKHLVGGSGNEVLYGGRGSDIILGNEGNDLLVGNDFLSGKVGEYSHPVKDALSGGGGNDVVWVDNDPVGKDIVTCGSGFDRVLADRADVVAPECEKVFIAPAAVDKFFNSIPQSFWRSLPYPFGPQYPSKPGDYAKAAGLAMAFDRANINPLVGDWRRNLRCEEYVCRMKQAGLADMLPDNRCQGEKVRQHDHIFYRDGRFTSVGEKGDFEDNGHYILPNDHTIVFPGSGSKTFPPVKAHFRFSDYLNTVTFDLVVPKNLDECSERCQGTYEWAISVFYSGLPWHRVCQADNKDNNVNGRTDELGEPCWIEPVKGLTYE
jgi:hypothetical protein